MRTYSLITMFCLLLLGCLQQGEDAPLVTHAADSTVEIRAEEEDKAEDDELEEQQRELERLLGPKLNDLATVDKIMREVDGVEIHGSALDDTHVASILKLTDRFGRIHANCQSNTIVHESHSQCYRRWLYEEGSFAINLELIDGRWELGALSLISSTNCRFYGD